MYSSGVTQFTTFCLMYGLSYNGIPSEVNEDTLIRFATHCASSLHLKYTTIKCYLAGIRNIYIKRGQGDILLDRYGCQRERLQLVLRGIKKDQQHTPHRRQPITVDILRQLTSFLHIGVFGAYRDLIMESALLMGWFGCLRSGEFTAANSEYDASIHIAIRDVREKFDSVIHKKYMEVQIKGSKTDPFRRGVAIKLFETGKKLCPFTVLSKLLSLRKAYCQNQNDPFFYLPECTVLTRTVFVNNLKVLLRLIGQDDWHTFSGHSLRRGLATSASAANVPDHLIASMGRWQSDCYKMYIDIPNISIASAQCTLADPQLTLA